MNERVNRIGNFAHKQFHCTDADRPALMIQRSRLLGESGMRTPVAIWDPHSNEMISPWIEGRTGRAHLTSLQSDDGLSQWKELSNTEQARLMDPLVQLHNASPAGLDLQPLDIWRRITPRLASDSGLSLDGRSDEIEDLYHRLRDQQAALEQLHQASRVPIHGDYHVNQIIVAKQDGEPWLLDLDDMALGFPEIDLGNFIVNLATNADLLIVGVMEDYRALKAILCPAYLSLGGRLPNTRLIDFYAAVSLLRRVLKFYQTGRRNPDPEDILRACETLTCRLTLKN